MSARLGDPRLPWLALGGCLAAAAALILWLQSQLGFAYDEWDFLLGRRDFALDAFFAPHHEHIAISHVAIYKALAEAFGIDSPRPFQVVSTAMFLGSAAVLFAFLRRRVGGWLAFAALLPILVFGPAADNVVWPFQLAFSGSMAAGLGSLLALDRDDRSGDLLACALLVVAISFSSLGIPFVIGAAVQVALRDDRRRRAWVPLVPIFLFGLWWLGWGRDAESFLSFKNLATAPSYVIDGFASSLASLLGLSAGESGDGVTAVDAGRPLLVLAACFAALRLRRVGRVPLAFWVALAIGVSFWLLAALNANAFRPPIAGRYQLIGAIFVLLLAAELLRGVRVSRAATICVAVVAVVAAASNLETLRQQWLSFRGETEFQRGAVTAVEIARERVEPGFVIGAQDGVTIFGDAGLYLASADELGSPAYALDELATAPELARSAVDRVLAEALPVRLREVSARPPANGPPPSVLLGEAGPVAGGCAVAGGEEAFGAAAVSLAPGNALIDSATGSTVAVTARRFGSEFAVDLGAVGPAHPAIVAIPTDGSREPWELRLESSGPVTVCGGIGP